MAPASNLSPGDARRLAARRVCLLQRLERAGEQHLAGKRRLDFLERIKRSTAEERDRFPLVGIRNANLGPPASPSKMGARRPTPKFRKLGFF